ncbi:hypothetical protein F4819DRAFT_111389 [Hypoxylon fuscum]|nr:hypothetical protein F4819DRAFT_111389 [Hypoxylon fuscum]
MLYIIFSFLSYLLLSNYSHNIVILIPTRIVTTARHSVGAVSRGRLVFPHRSNTNTYIPKSSAHTTTLSFSTSQSRLADKESTKNSQKSPEEPPPMGFSLEGLDLSRNTKIAVIAILSIFGTIESIFWIKWIWTWLKVDKEEEPESKA